MLNHRLCFAYSRDKGQSFYLRVGTVVYPEYPQHVLGFNGHCEADYAVNVGRGLEICALALVMCPCDRPLGTVIAPGITTTPVPATDVPIVMDATLRPSAPGGHYNHTRFGFLRVLLRVGEGSCVLGANATGQRRTLHPQTTLRSGNGMALLRAQSMPANQIQWVTQTRGLT